MTYKLPHTEAQRQFLHQVEAAGAENITACYQCGKCTAGCPSAFAMDYPPHQIIRGVQLGMRDLVLASHTIWVCAACETCSTRCPQEADPAAVMDALRRIAYAEGLATPEPDGPLFHRIFLGTIARFGRVFEAGLMGMYNVFSGHLLKDVGKAPGLLLKGKLSLLPPRVGNTRGLREMVARVRAKEAELR